MVWPAVIAAAGTLYAANQARKSAQNQARQQEAIQREFAQHSIRWRTEDAKAAGLHPLYAMGASGSTYSPITYTDPLPQAMANAGQSIASAYYADSARKTAAADRQQANNRSLSDSNFMRKMAQDRMILEQQKLAAQINSDNAMASFYRSQAARANQASNSQQDLPIQDENAELVGGLVQEVPNPIPSPSKENPSHTAGVAPGWRVVNLGPFKAVTPYSEEGWGEDLNISKLGLIAAATTLYYTFGVALPNITAYIKDKKAMADLKKNSAYRKNLKRLGQIEAKKARIESFGLGQPRPRR